MKKVVISGYYGFNNAGDEAILSGLLCALRREAKNRNEKIECTVLSARPQQTAAKHQVKAIGRMSVWQIIRVMLSCNLFISGGGGLLQDSTGMSLSVAYYLGLVLLAKMFGKKAILYAHGIGPVRKPLNKWLIKLIANRAAQITVRDKASLQALYDMGVNRPPMELTADPAFLVQQKESPDYPVFSQGRPVIGLAVRSWEGKDRYLKEIARAADALADEFSANLFLIPMYYSADLPATKELAGMLEHDAVILEEYLEPDRLMDLVSKLDLMLSVRLHALIFAAAAGVPMVGIGYDPKVDAFLAQLELTAAGSTREVRAADVILQGREYLQRHKTMQDRLREKREQLRAQAEGTIRTIAAALFESGETP